MDRNEAFIDQSVEKGDFMIGLGAIAASASAATVGAYAIKALRGGRKK